MTQDQKKRAESLFHVALTLPPEERMAFLRRECSDDRLVFDYSASLVSNHQKMKGILGLVEEEIESPLPILAPGDRIGRYEVLSLLGRGGMGEVYLAQDQRLQRKVAIKILPAVFSGNPDLIERLQGEAQAASALNHPNILTIHEFGQESEQHYIVSEFVEGTSLRDLIGKISDEQAFEYGREIGQALAAAHSVGIVHRDIKPENIIVRNDGYLKVLDFGLAKLTSRPVEAISTIHSASAKRQATQPGIVMGTLNYMSPEQARGETVDARTDIWSWGVVFYEMLAGHRPYEVSSAAEIHAAHATEIEPARRDKKIHRLLAKAMAVERGNRYSTMAEALEELEQAQPGLVRRYSRQAIRSLTWRDGKVPWIPWAVLLAVLSLMGSGVYWIINRPYKYTISSSRQMTATGNVVTTAVSPDGQHCFYATQEVQGQVLRLIDLSNGTYSEVAPPQDFLYWGITISRAGDTYYVARKNAYGKLLKLSSRNGMDELVADDVDSPVSLSADEKKFVFFRAVPQDDEVLLVVHDLQKKEERKVLALHWPDNFSGSPLWSPDGKEILIAASFVDHATHVATFKLESVNADSGKVVRAIDKPWQWMGTPVWLNHGSSLAASVAGVASRAQLTQIDWPSGRESSMTRDIQDYRELSATSDYKSIVTRHEVRLSSLWVAPLSDLQKARSLQTSGRMFHGVAWTTSGKIISETEMGDKSGLWLIDPKGRDPQLITSDPHLYQDVVASPNGKYMVYISNRDGVPQLWRSDADGKNQLRLTRGSSREIAPAFSPDGQWVFYTSVQQGYSLWKVPISGGTSVKVTTHDASEASVSPDGKFIVCKYLSDDFLSWKTALLDDTGKFLRYFDNIPARLNSTPVLWAPDGKDLLFVADDQNQVSNLWAQPFDGGNSRQLTHFTDDSIFDFALSSDGKMVALVRGKTTSDVLLMQVDETRH